LLNTGRYHHTAALLPDGKVLVAGGYNSSSSTSLNSSEIYDPDLETWSVINPMNEARTAHGMIFFPNGAILVVGGRNADTTYLSSAEQRVQAGIWGSAGFLNEPRSDHTATLLSNGQVLVAGGYNSTDYTLRSAELYSKNSISGRITCLGQLENSTHTVFVDLHTSTSAPPEESAHIQCGETYVFYDLPDGPYYIGAWLDMDDSGGGPPDPGEPHAWYEDTLGDPEQIWVSEDLSITGIDIQLECKGSLLFLPLIRR